MHGARRLPKEYREDLHTQIQRSIACLQNWIDRGLLAAVDPHHLLLTLWAVTQTYVNFGRQISAITGKRKADEADYEAVISTITQMVVRGTAPEARPTSTNRKPVSGSSGCLDKAFLTLSQS
nr:TetR family transcriptional regulator C-terminal domain-containing protein [Pseudomonas akapageensis]